MDIFFGEFEELFLVAKFGDGDNDAAGLSRDSSRSGMSALTKTFAAHPGIGQYDVKGHNDFGGDVAKFFAQMLDGIHEQCLAVFIEVFGKREV